MYGEEIIAMRYKPVEVVRSKINWIQIAQKYRIKKKFSSIMEKLEKKGYVDSHGKSGAVYSLSFQGVAYVKGTP
jgi:DNA-binding IscR family transcriptional regulator